MTVSLSLRESPKISPATRERVQKLAQKLGYHPDPELSRLMKHLRSSRTARGRIGVAVMDFYPGSGFVENGYNRSIREGATQRAEQLGFSLTTVRGAEYRNNLRQMLSVVRHRGIEGVMLMPAVIATLSLDAQEDWHGLSVVATSNSILSPRFHCVVPHQFANMMRLLDAMQARGHKRICAIFDEFFDERTAHNFTAALNWNRHGQRTLVLANGLSSDQRHERAADWIAKHQPDLVFAQSAAVTGALERLPARVKSKLKVFWLGAPGKTKASYLDERAELVGSAAIDLLAGMMYYHEVGIPRNPRTTMIDGQLEFVAETASLI